MHWVNEAEIDTWKERYAGDALLGPATRYLSDYRDLIDSCSDGWAYWSYGTRCAKALIALLTYADYQARGIRHLLPEGYQPPSQRDVEQAVQKIERFVQREPQLVGQVPPRLELKAAIRPMEKQGDARMRTYMVEVKLTCRLETDRDDVSLQQVYEDVESCVMSQLEPALAREELQHHALSDDTRMEILGYERLQVRETGVGRRIGG